MKYFKFHQLISNHSTLYDNGYELALTEFQNCTLPAKMITVTAPLIATANNQKIFLPDQVRPLLESGLYSKNII